MVKVFEFGNISIGIRMMSIFSRNFPNEVTVYPFAERRADLLPQH